MMRSAAIPTSGAHMWGTTMPDSHLVIEQLRAWYGESIALQGISLQVNRGETVAILGRNGAGKTTTLRAVAGIMRRTEGSIRIGSQEILKLPCHRVAYTGLGYVPEERGIFASLSVRENLMLPPVVLPGGIGVDDLLELFPNLRARFDSPGSKLSGGEQQMLAIARVLRTGANLLLLDEPTEGLAPVIIKRIAEVIQDLKHRGLTCVLVEQNFEFARTVADRFYVMEEGSLIDGFDRSELEARSASLRTTLGL